MLTEDALIRRRCTDDDWCVWEDRARADSVIAATRSFRTRLTKSMDGLSRFCGGERGYIGVSWGKDSCAVVKLALLTDVDWPLVYVRLDPVENPDCVLVRDAWLNRYPQLANRYHEVSVRCAIKPSTGRYDTNAAYAAGFRECARMFGERRVSGVRAEESGSRSLAMAVHGAGDVDSKTARPIGWWKSGDVFALLRDEALHPAYPCSMAGSWERGRVRVNNLWGLYGEGHGRAEWERRYYREELAQIERIANGLAKKKINNRH